MFNENAQTPQRLYTVPAASGTYDAFISAGDGTAHRTANTVGYCYGAALSSFDPLQRLPTSNIPAPPARATTAEAPSSSLGAEAVVSRSNHRAVDTSVKDREAGRLLGFGTVTNVVEQRRCTATTTVSLAGSGFITVTVSCSRPNPVFHSSTASIAVSSVTIGAHPVQVDYGNVKVVGE
ncbi:hypothetical protein HPP92_014551 [Vanilla planifolia]|uniref:Uncharacterized protein n=1 Tax=Vanilla planifolia TaxID=51239 RepID=A0A835QMX6_VANPL|nr:hypothetical protein HPP92_014551 [Vanilla planifolia]